MGAQFRDYSVADELDGDSHDIVRSPSDALEQLLDGLLLGRAAVLEVDGAGDARVGGEAARDREGPVAEKGHDSVPVAHGLVGEEEGSIAVDVGVVHVGARLEEELGDVVAPVKGRARKGTRP